jgi:uncharacterized protein (TIGR02611 family)
VGLGVRCASTVRPDSPRHAAAPEVLLDSEPEEQQAAGTRERLTRRLKGVRSWVHRRPSGVAIWRVGIALIGLVVIIVGVVLLALPGPGWLVIFAGVGIWATEFAWAKSLLKSVRRAVGKWTAWIERQPRWLTMLVGGLGLILVAAVVAGVWAVAL